MWSLNILETIFTAGMSAVLIPSQLNLEFLKNEALFERTLEPLNVFIPHSLGLS